MASNSIEVKSKSMHDKSVKYKQQQEKREEKDEENKEEKNKGRSIKRRNKCARIKLKENTPYFGQTVFFLFRFSRTLFAIFFLFLFLIPSKLFSCFFVFLSFVNGSSLHLLLLPFSLPFVLDPWNKPFKVSSCILYIQYGCSRMDVWIANDDHNVRIGSERINKCRET